MRTLARLDLPTPAGPRITIRGHGYFSQLLTDGSQLFLVTELVTRRGRRLMRTLVTIMFYEFGQNMKSH